MMRYAGMRGSSAARSWVFLLIAAVMFLGIVGPAVRAAGAERRVLRPDGGWISPRIAHGREILYVLVNVGRKGSYVALYPADAPNPQQIGKITAGLGNPGALWVDSAGNLYVGNDLTYHSSVTVYAPGAITPSRTYTKGVDLPFGGTVDGSGSVYVSDAGVRGQLLGGVAVFPPGATKPAKYLLQNVHVPHGVSVDRSGNVFVADIYGSTQTTVVEFAAGSTTGTILPLNDLQGGFLEDLKLDAHDDLVVADAKANAVRFYPPPYVNESRALTTGLSAPTGLAFGPHGALFVGNEYINSQQGNVVIFPPGATVPSRRITAGITGGVLGVAVGRIP
jgi:serine/threonine protein kinase, bacterial